MQKTSLLTDFIQDSKLETVFQPNSTLPEVTIHIKPSGLRRVAKREVWLRERTLGRGGFGLVWLERRDGYAQNAPELRAVKQIKTGQQIVNDGSYLRELEALIKFSQDKYCDSFVKCYGWYEDFRKESLFIAMEYCEYGDLQTYLANNGRLPELEGQIITEQILHGLRSMHENGFAHRDMKSANILIKSKPPNDWWVKICDLGLSKRIEEETHSNMRGTLKFLPPEMLSRDAELDPFAADMWQFGTTVFYVLTNQAPFPSPVETVQYRKGTFLYPEKTLKSLGVSNNAISFLRLVMAADPAERMTAVAATGHVWVRDEEAHQTETNFLGNTARDQTIPLTKDDTTLPSGEWTLPIKHTNAVKEHANILSDVTRTSGLWTVNLLSSLEEVAEQQNPIDKNPKDLKPSTSQSRTNNSNQVKPVSARKVKFEQETAQMSAQRDLRPEAREAPKSVLVPDNSFPLETPVHSSAHQQTSRYPGTAQTVEKDVLNAFKSFVATEKARAAEHTRRVHAVRKVDEIKDLQSFGRNFELKTPVPQDLYPILGKHVSTDKGV